MVIESALYYRQRYGRNAVHHLPWLIETICRVLFFCFGCHGPFRGPECVTIHPTTPSVSGCTVLPRP